MVKGPRREDFVWRARKGGRSIMRITKLWIHAAAFALLISSHAIANERIETTTEHFDIRSQPLSQALRVYALQTGDQVVFFSEVGRGRDSAAISGQFTRDEA